MKRPKLWIVFVFPGIILITGVGFYISHFNGGQFSDKSPDWGGFGSYLTMFVNLSNLCVAIFFSALVFRFNQDSNENATKRAKDIEKFQRDLQHPVLTFKTVMKGDKEFWQIVNVGNGPALNLLVGHKFKADGNWENPLVKCYSLAKEDFIDIDWKLHGPDVIGVYYKDIFGHPFVSLVGSDISEVRPFDESFVPIVINDKVYGRVFFDEMLLVKADRLARVRSQGSTGTTSSTTTIEQTIP